MDLRIVDENKVLITEDVIETEYVFEINLSNNSDYDYIIPIDTANYRYYFPEETCANFYRLENYPDLGIIFKIKNKKIFIVRIYTFNRRRTISNIRKRERKRKNP